MKELILATNNMGKLEEMKRSVSNELKLVSYRELVDHPVAFEETGNSYVENATIKASALAELLQKPVIGDDGGLEIKGLPHQLGVHTNRFFNAGLSDAEKNQQLLKAIAVLTDVQRQFRLVCVLVYVDPIKKIKHRVEEALEGEIVCLPRGTGGYGFDEILYLPEKKKTLAELSEEERMALSPRSRGIKRLLTEWKGASDE